MRRPTTALGAGLVALVLPALVRAALVWTMTVSPTIATQGQPTGFVVTTSVVVGGNIGCIGVDLPASFAIQSVSTPIASNGGNWRVSVSANAVIASALTDPDRISKVGQSVSMTINAVPTAAGAFTWPNHVADHPDCSGSTLTGVPLPVTILPAPTPTPSPTQVPTPTPRPTPVPTPTPVSTAWPTGSPTRSPNPSASESDGSSRTPTPPGDGVTTGGEPSATPGSSTSATPSPSPRGTQAAAPRALTVVPFDDSASGGGGVDFGTGLNVLSRLGDPFTWLVPGATVAGPGLLVLLFVGLQAIGALAWIPAVRRMGDHDDRRRRPRRPVSRGA